MSQTTNNVRDLIRINDAVGREARMRSTLESVRLTLTECAQALQQSAQLKYTGWCVLLKQTADSWECVAIVNPDKSETIPEEWDLSLPIPTRESSPEFQGW